jgi:hypothetical protein
MRFDAAHSRNPGAGDRAAAQLRADPARSDLIISVAASCHPETVSRVRHALEQSGTIPVVPASARTPQSSRGRKPGTPRIALARAAHELTVSATASNEQIAALSGTSVWAARTARKRLESIGYIPHIPPSARTRKPMPPLRSPARDAIYALGPDATPRAVADAAGISMQAAWKALQRTRPRLADAAAASDVLAVSRVPAGMPLVLEAALTRRWPAIPDWPEPPDWSRARCATAPASIQGYWTSSDEAERGYARAICQRCPVREPCEQWSLALPYTDSAIYGGMSTHERHKRKRAYLQELARQALCGYRG